MRKIKNLLVFSVLYVTLTVTTVSCDFLRSVAGRPTSDMIEAKREQILEAQRKQQASADSLAAIVAREADNAAAMDSLSRLCVIHSSSSMSQRIDFSGVDPGCYVMLGSFSNPDNVSRFVARVVNEGYGVVPMHHRNGNTAIGVGPFEEGVSILQNYLDLSGETFFPSDAWVIKVEE